MDGAIGGPRCPVYVVTSLRNEYLRCGIVFFIVILLQSITLAVWRGPGFYLLCVIEIVLVVRVVRSG